LSDFFEGDLAEFMIYGVAISEDERKDLEFSLSKKYGIKLG